MNNSVSIDFLTKRDLAQAFLRVHSLSSHTVAYMINLTFLVDMNNMIYDVVSRETSPTFPDLGDGEASPR